MDYPLLEHVFLQPGWGGVCSPSALGKRLRCFLCIHVPRLRHSEVGVQPQPDCEYSREAESAARQGWVCWPSLEDVYLCFPTDRQVHFWRPPSRDSRAGHGGSWGPVPSQPAHSGQCGQGCATLLCLRGCDSAEACFRRFPWKPSRQQEKGAFWRQLQPRRVVTRARLGRMAFPGAELLQLGMGKQDALASPHQLPSDVQKAFVVLLLQSLTQGFVFAGAGRSRSETSLPTCSGR